MRANKGKQDHKTPAGRALRPTGKTARAPELEARLQLQQAAAIGQERLAECRIA